MFKAFNYSNDSFSLSGNPLADGSIELRIKDHSGKRTDFVEIVDDEAQLALRVGFFLRMCVKTEGEVVLPD